MRAPKSRLPRGIRFAALLAALFAGLVWFKSVWELLEVLDAAGITEALRTSTPVAASDRPFLDATIAYHEEAERSVGPMREFRALTLGALWLCSLMVLSSALRLLRPAALPRAGDRQRLARMAVAAALLRAVDGAQALALTRKLAAPFERLALVQFERTARLWELQPTPTPEQIAHWASLSVRLQEALSLGTTVLVAGVLLALGQYFGSARVREAVAQQDRALEGPRASPRDS